MTRDIDWNGKCHRCGKRSQIHTMSKFNTDLICPDCDEREQEHPRFEEAVTAELAAVRNGDYNFQGIGLPTPTDPERDRFKIS